MPIEMTVLMASANKIAMPFIIRFTAWLFDGKYENYNQLLDFETIVPSSQTLK